MRCPHCQRKIGGASWNDDAPARPVPAPRITPEGRALEGELAEALRTVLPMATCGARMREQVEALIARYDASQPPASIPQGDPAAKEGT